MFCIKCNGNGFRCFDKPKPPATKELAIQRYASEYPPETICAPLKLNSPFQSTRNVEVPATTRLSLSFAAAQAVFALLGIALVALLRKLQKLSTTSSESLSTDGDLRSMMRKLRLTVDRLDSKINHLGTGQDQLRTDQDVTAARCVIEKKRSPGVAYSAPMKPRGGRGPPRAQWIFS